MSNNIDEIAKKILEDNEELFRDLASIEEFEKTKPNKIELDIAHWIILNKSGIEDQIKNLYRPNYNLFPASLYEVYLNDYKNNVVGIIRDNIAQSHQLNPEELINYVSADLITTLLGNSFLEPGYIKEKLNDAKSKI